MKQDSMKNYLLPAIAEICNFGRELTGFKSTMFSIAQLKYYVNAYYRLDEPIQDFIDFMMRAMKSLVDNTNLYDKDSNTKERLKLKIDKSSIFTPDMMKETIKKYESIVKNVDDKYKNFIKIGFSIPNQHGMCTELLFTLPKVTVGFKGDFTEQFKLFSLITSINFVGPFQLVDGNAREFNVLSVKRIIGTLKAVIKDKKLYSDIEKDFPRSLIVTILAPFCFDPDFKEGGELLELINGKYSIKRVIEILNKMEAHYNRRTTAISHTPLGIIRENGTDDYYVYETYTIYKDTHRANSKYSNRTLSYRLNPEYAMGENFVGFINRITMIFTFYKLVRLYEESDNIERDIKKFIEAYDKIEETLISTYNKLVDSYNALLKSHKEEEETQKEDTKKILWN